MPHKASAAEAKPAIKELGTIEDGSALAETFKASAAMSGKKGSCSSWFSLSANVTNLSRNSGYFSSTRCAARRRFKASRGAARPKHNATAIDKKSTTRAAVTKPGANSSEFKMITSAQVAVRAASAAMAKPRAVAPQRKRLSILFKYAANDSRGFMRPPYVSYRRFHRQRPHQFQGAATR